MELSGHLQVLGEAQKAALIQDILVMIVRGSHMSSHYTINTFWIPTSLRTALLF
jgi:hypothetical protein